MRLSSNRQRHGKTADGRTSRALGCGEKPGAGLGPAPGDRCNCPPKRPGGGIIGYDLASESRISVRSLASSEGSGGASGASSSFLRMLFMALIIMKMTKAMITKSTMF